MMPRNNSGPLAPKIGIENLCSSLAQKDKIITILQKQLQGFRCLRENYDRLKDRKTQLLDKCESLSREITINRSNQDMRSDHNQKYIAQLRSTVANLENQLQNRQYQLKDLRCEAESLIKSSQDRQNNLLLSGQSIQEIKSSMEIVKMESARLYQQISQIREEIERVRQYQIDTEAAREKIKGQIHNTQTFIRQLGYEESKLSESLSTLEDQNNSIDQIIQDLKKVYEMTKIKMREVKDEKEEIAIKIKTKELEKGRTQAQHSQRMKHFKAQRQKQKNLKQVTESKKSQIARLTTTLKQVVEQSDQLMKQNMQIENINIQLQKDLHICCKHLENVSKTNSIVKDKIDTFSRINMTAIRKLRKPVDEGWVELAGKKDTEGMETTGDGFLDKSV